MDTVQKPRQPMIEVKNVKKVYRMGDEKIKAVDDVSFKVYDGEFCCLTGTSGSGKSTILNVLAGIEKVTSGEIILRGVNITKMSEAKLARFRQSSLGFVFQSYNLIGTLTAIENVELPLTFKRVRRKKRHKEAIEMLKKVGLGARMNHKPSEMSGGQQQRVGIARAFVGKPKIIFADEPTGNLDTRTTVEVMEIITRMARENNQTIVMVTHDPSLTKYADRVLTISDGKVINEYVNDRSEIDLTNAAAETEKTKQEEIVATVAMTDDTERDNNEEINN